MVRFLSLFSLLFFLTFSQMAHANTPLEVNIATDAIDGNLADGICDTDLTTVDEECSLRAAIQTANANSGDDTIVFSDSLTDPICLTLTGSSENVSVSGDLDITSNMTITGNGARTTIIDGGSNAACTTSLGDRIFNIYSGTPTVTFEDLTISGGDLSATPTSPGAGIRIQSATEVTFNNVHIQDNSGVISGAGISDSSGTLTVNNSTIAYNNTSSSSSGMGCGISVGSSATVNIVNSTIFSNGDTVSCSKGGGIYNSGTTNLYNSTLAFNSAATGGGVYNNGSTLNVKNSVLSDNTGTTTAADCYNSTYATFTLAGVNLIADTTGCGTSSTDFSTHLTGQTQGWATTDFGDHGGGTDTLAPSECGSGVRLDQGSDCTDAIGSVLMADQRGEAYGENGLSSCPIGSYAVVSQTDSDGDGTLACSSATDFTVYDCDDSDATAYPGATEVCDSVDNDCDGSVDEGLSDCVAGATDTDGDGVADSTDNCPSTVNADQADNDGDDIGDACDDTDDDSTLPASDAEDTNAGVTVTGVNEADSGSGTSSGGCALNAQAQTGFHPASILFVLLSLLGTQVCRRRLKRF